MAYFTRDDRKSSPPRRHGIAVGAKPIPELPKPLTRDELIEGAINQMQPRNNSDAKALGPMRFIADTEAKNPTRVNPHRHRDNDIFGPPVEAVKPKPRIRVGVSEAELAKIWHEDEAKFQAALKMERGTNLVEKMAAEPINPVINSARSKDAQPPPRRQIDLLTETQVERNRSEAPAGFSGMGAHSRPQPKTGVMCKPVEQFMPPEYAPRNRNEGRRTKFPPDTFSFQDDSQTY